MSITNNNTIDYYENNASSFTEDTQDVRFTDVQNRFLALLPQSGYILDFGCGSGRDTKFFITRGYQVDASDGSERLCEIASKNTGIAVKHMLFSELDEDAKYDGIWACASILHVPREELKTVFEKMIKAVKPGGYIYTSFKYGEYEGYRKDRYYTDFTSESFRGFARDFPEIVIIDEWISADVRPGRGDEKWLNLILRRSDTV